MDITCSTTAQCWLCHNDSNENAENARTRCTKSSIGGGGSNESTGGWVISAAVNCSSVGAKYATSNVESVSRGNELIGDDGSSREREEKDDEADRESSSSRSLEMSSD